MRIVVRGSRDAGANRVMNDVVGEVLEDLISPYRVIVEPALPERSGATQSPVDLESSAALCPGNYLAEFVAGQELKHPVNMIGHDDKTEVVAGLFSVALLNLRNDDTCRIGGVEYATVPIAPRRDHIDAVGL